MVDAPSSFPHSQAIDEDMLSELLASIPKLQIMKLRKIIAARKGVVEAAPVKVIRDTCVWVGTAPEDKDKGCDTLGNESVSQI